MVALYAAIVLLFSLPSMQKALADGAAHVLSKQLHSKVEIGSINLGLLNRLVVSDVEIYGPSGVRMASIARVSASINWASLFSEQIEIGTAQLFGTKVWHYLRVEDLCLYYLSVKDGSEQPFSAVISFFAWVCEECLENDITF